MTTMDSKSRFPAFGIGPNQTTKGSMRTSTKPIGSVWNPTAWGNNGTIGSGVRNGGQDIGRASNELADSSPITEPLTGSRSLLPSSESDTRTVRQTSWKNSGEDISPGLPIGNTSPLLRQKSNHSVAHSFGEADIPEAPYFSITAASRNVSSQSSQANLFDPHANNFVSGIGDGMGSHQSSRHNSDENDAYAARRVFGNKEPGLTMRSETASVGNSLSGYNSSAASRSGSQPPSRGDVDYTSRQRGDFRNFPYNRGGPPNTGVLRSNVSANAPPFVAQASLPSQAHTNQLSPTQLELNTYFERLSTGRDESQSDMAPPQNSYENSFSMRGNLGQERVLAEQWHGDDSSTQLRPDQVSPTGSGSGSIGSTSHQYRNHSLPHNFTHSPNSSDARMSHQSPFYSTGGTPPYQQHVSHRSYHNGQPNTQAALLERKLQGLQEQQQLQQRQGYGGVHSNPLQVRNQMPHPYDIQAPNALRLNPLNYYNMAPAHLIGGPHIPRGPARDMDAGQQVRSPLLEEFRNNSKTNKRYELKDIYHHIVEFSGDQHGSRFIQQKLETANSDEKDQVFRELQPNARQLMTDVFGNYVIQKFFEHGNQAQKKLLANQMRNHVLALSMQIYGCRVVQKALEHILTDQQALLVKELKNDVMKCVKDQNGNHVIQKAIERVPAEHIQFIINAFTGRVQESATHPYGCRVIQRMLEYCEEPTRTAVLQELHACASALIIDQYGNYVTQHVIEHGQPEDRARIIQLVTLQLVNYSKHKFASNVVEKSIQFGSLEERQAIVRILSVINDKGESPVQGLIRDQYGNYVMQKLITQLRGPEWNEFIELIKVQISLLKRFSFGNGKQIAAVEKVLYQDAFQPPHMQQNNAFPPLVDTANAPTPPLATSGTQSPQSSSVPSTHANSIDASHDSRKSSGSTNPTNFALSST